MFNIYIVAARTAVCKRLNKLFQERKLYAAVLYKFYITYAKINVKIALRNCPKMTKRDCMKGKQRNYAAKKSKS